MSTPPPVRARIARELVEGVVLAGIVAFVNALGWYGGHSTPVLLAITVPLLLMNSTTVQLRLSGGDLSRRVPARMFLHLVVCFGPAAFVSGWGPVMMSGLIPATVAHMRWTGAGVWRLATAYSVLTAAAGAAAIRFGLVTDYFGKPDSYVLCGLTLLVVLLVIRSYGETLEQREQAEAEAVASQAAARRSERWFRALVQNTSDVICVVDSARLVTYVSEAAELRLSHRPADLLGGPVDSIVDPGDRDAFASFLDGVVGHPLTDHRTELRLWHADGTPRWYELTGHDLLDDPEIAGVVLNCRDVHERRAYHDLLAFDASHDALTGLANRAELNRALEEALLLRAASLAAAADDESLVPTVAVLLIDLDGFKPVNDAHGHECGDALLVTVAWLLGRNVLGVDTVARIGGDEFVVLLGGINREADAIAVAERMLRALGAPLRLPHAEVRIGASIGIALAEGDVSAVELLRQADHAMYRAKREGRNRWASQHPGAAGQHPSEAEIAAAGAAALERDLRIALATGRGLSVAYQPIVLLEDRSLWGFEALMRWAHPTRGPVPPAEFVPIAERTGLIHDLGRWVLDHACRQVAQWQRTVPDGRGFCLSVNLSARDLDQPGIADLVLETITAAGLDAEHLVIEVTESALVDPDLAIPALARLSDAGIRIAIDDFGTGYSSLQYLTQMPVDILKLDRSFVSRLDGSPQRAAIAEAVVRLSQTLRLATVAEGVETEEQAAELMALGYDKAQGYLFSRPLTAQDAAQKLIADGVRH